MKDLKITIRNLNLEQFLDLHRFIGDDLKKTTLKKFIENLGAYMTKANAGRKIPVNSVKDYGEVEIPIDGQHITKKGYNEFCNLLYAFISGEK